MPSYKWKVAWNSAYSPFKFSKTISSRHWKVFSKHIYMFKTCLYVQNMSICSKHVYMFKTCLYMFKTCIYVQNMYICSKHVYMFICSYGRGGGKSMENNFGKGWEGEIVFRWTLNFDWLSCSTGKKDFLNPSLQIKLNRLEVAPSL